MVTSNCVLNLVPDKQQAFREIARVLKPGGCFVASDTVLLRKLSPEMAASERLYVCCVAGAAPRDEYLGLLENAGLTQAEILSQQDVTEAFAGGACCDDSTGGGLVASVTVRAFKPGLRSGFEKRSSELRPLLVVLGLADRVLPLTREMNLDVVFVGPNRSRAPAGSRFFELDLNNDDAIVKSRGRPSEVAADCRCVEP